MRRGVLTLQSSLASSGRGRDARVDVDGVSCEVVFPDEPRGRLSGADEQLGTSRFCITAFAKVVVMSLLAAKGFQHWTM